MKVFAIAAALLPLAALAAPMNDGYKAEDKHDKEYKDHGKDSHDVGLIHNGPFYFTSTYKTYATPDQVYVLPLISATFHSY